MILEAGWEIGRLERRGYNKEVFLDPGVQVPEAALWTLQRTLEKVDPQHKSVVEFEFTHAVRRYAGRLEHDDSMGYYFLAELKLVPIVVPEHTATP